MTRRVDVVLLCEDRQQEVFARRYLEYSGFDPRRIRPNTCPKGEGSGEQYVREQYPEQVRSL